MDKAAHKASELVKQDIKDAALAKETPESTEEKGGKPPKSPKKKATPKRKLRTATKKKATPKKNKPTKPTDAPETEAKDDSSGAAVAKKNVEMTTSWAASMMKARPNPAHLRRARKKTRNPPHQSPQRLQRLRQRRAERN